MCVCVCGVCVCVCVCVCVWCVLIYCLLFLPYKTWTYPLSEIISSLVCVPPSPACFIIHFLLFISTFKPIQNAEKNQPQFIRFYQFVTSTNELSNTPADWTGSLIRSSLKKLTVTQLLKCTVLWDSNVHFRIHNSSPLIQSQMNPAQNLRRCYFF